MFQRTAQGIISGFCLRHEKALNTIGKFMDVDFSDVGCDIYAYKNPLVAQYAGIIPGKHPERPTKNPSSMLT